MSTTADHTLSSLLGPARERALSFVYQPIVIGCQYLQVPPSSKLDGAR